MRVTDFLKKNLRTFQGFPLNFKDRAKGLVYVGWVGGSTNGARLLSICGAGSVSRERSGFGAKPQTILRSPFFRKKGML